MNASSLPSGSSSTVFKILLGIIVLVFSKTVRPLKYIVFLKGLILASTLLNQSRPSRTGCVSWSITRNTNSQKESAIFTERFSVSARAGAISLLAVLILNLVCFKLKPNVCAVFNDKIETSAPVSK